ncbi:hypothetical protein MNEG_9536, partial [Monoraphidium neglectum]
MGACFSSEAPPTAPAAASEAQLAPVEASVSVPAASLSSVPSIPTTPSAAHETIRSTSERTFDDMKLLSQ